MGWLSDENFQTPRKTVNSERDSFLIQNINSFGGERAKFLHATLFKSSEGKIFLHSLFSDIYNLYRVQYHSSSAMNDFWDDQFLNKMNKIYSATATHLTLS